MLVETEWHTHGQTFLFLFAVKKDMQRLVCIIDRAQNDILLLVQEDKKLEHREPVDLVAEGVAGFNENNANRETVELPPLVDKVGFLLSLFLGPKSF
jgi:hypothetical protein